MEPTILPPDQMAARQILRKCIEEGLRQGLGESGLAMVSSLRPIDSSAEDPRRLHELLVGIFKEEGASIIEAKIANILLDKLGSGDRLEAERSSLHGQGGKSEYEVVRRFVEIARLPGSRSRNHSMESTAASFVDAFTKGM